MLLVVPGFGTWLVQFGVGLLIAKVSDGSEGSRRHWGKKA